MQSCYKLILLTNDAWHFLLTLRRITMSVIIRISQSKNIDTTLNTNVLLPYLSDIWPMNLPEEKQHDSRRGVGHRCLVDRVY